jgi:excisionase family DNA binding protein
VTAETRLTKENHQVRKPKSAAGDSAPRFYTVAEAAELLRTCDMTLYRAIHDGEFPAIKVRGRYVIPALAVQRMEEAALSLGGMVDAADWATGVGAVA